MADCTFCSIVAGETPAYLVLEDPIAIAFLDTRPLFPGHVLLIPRGHHETLADLPPELVGPLFERVQLMARAVQEAMGSAGTFVAMNNTISQSVPHLHVHVVPRNKRDGLKGFFWPRTTYTTSEQAIDVTVRIREAYVRLSGSG